MLKYCARLHREIINVAGFKQENFKAEKKKQTAKKKMFHLDVD